MSRRPRRTGHRAHGLPLLWRSAREKCASASSTDQSDRDHSVEVRCRVEDQGMFNSGTLPRGSLARPGTGTSRCDAHDRPAAERACCLLGCCEDRCGVPLSVFVLARRPLLQARRDQRRSTGRPATCTSPGTCSVRVGNAISAPWLAMMPEMCKSTSSLITWYVVHTVVCVKQ
jgi:hypothetical protein